jgi:hypothetical protein
MAKNKNTSKRSIFKSIKEIIFGYVVHDSASFALRNRATMEQLFILISIGDILGVPILPKYYSLRLLPYLFPKISNWKRRMLRERDLTFEAFGEIRGV